jgi:hypothetical protein
MPRRADGSVDIAAFPERIFGPGHVKHHPVSVRASPGTGTGSTSPHPAFPTSAMIVGMVTPGAAPSGGLQSCSVLAA